MWTLTTTIKRIGQNRDDSGLHTDKNSSVHISKSSALITNSDTNTLANGTDVYPSKFSGSEGWGEDTTDFIGKTCG